MSLPTNTSKKYYVVIIDAKGSCSEKRATSVKEFVDKCGFKSADGFGLIHTWNEYGVSIYGKSKGKSNHINKYDLPPPIDTPLFYGSLIVCRTPIENELVSSVTLSEWESIYNKLFGGFEDIDEINSNGNDETDIIEEEKHAIKGKQGYEKDGFVVDDDEIDEDYTTTTISKKTNKTKKTKIEKPKKTKKVKEEEIYYSVTDELVAEEYEE